MSLKLPDITKLSKKRGTAHWDLKIEQVFVNLGSKSDFECYFEVEDVIYRRDLLSDLLNDYHFKRQFNSIVKLLPQRDLRPVKMFKDNWRSEEDENAGELSEQAIRNQIAQVRRYLELPKTLEKLTELSSLSLAAIELKQFAREARLYLHEYSTFAEKRIPYFKTTEGRVDGDNANRVVEQIKTKYDLRIKEVLKMRRQLVYYLNLCIPFEITSQGKPIPSCAVEFLDPELRQGVIEKVYHPSYFRYRREGKKGKKLIVTKLNVPNNIQWNDKARNNFIQGANSQGKTVYIKTIGLNIHLAMSIGRMFAQYAQMSPVGRIFPCFDLGDTIGAGHFETGSKKIREMLQKVELGDLVLLDEVGGGTEPEVERTIAKGISDALRHYKVTSFNVTHDSAQWKDYITEESVQLLRVASLDDRKNRYRVWKGIAESGYGLKIAQKMGIDPESVDKQLSRLIR